MEKVYIRITLFHPPESDDIAKIHQIELSPPTFNGRIKYGIAGYEEQYSFDEFVKELRIKTGQSEGYKYSIKRGDKLGLFAVNAETGQKQIFGIDVSRDWPVYSKTGNSPMRRTDYIEITSYLENIGIL